MKAGYIIEGEERRGRDRAKRTLMSSKQVVGEIMAAGTTGERHWFREIKNGYEIDITIDLGAVAIIVPTGTLPGEKPRETEALRRGMLYMVANGAAIMNRVEMTLRGKAENGTTMNIIAQVSEIMKPLAAVRKIIKNGNRVVMDEEGSYIENKKTEENAHEKGKRHVCSNDRGTKESNTGSGATVRNNGNRRS